MDAERAGYGALGDQGSHLIDLARFLVGEIASVVGVTKTFISERPGPHGQMSPATVDDAWAAIFHFQNGALGTIETTKFAKGQKMRAPIEVYGSKGSLVFDLERMNELEVYLPEEENPQDAQGFRRVIVTEKTHPYFDVWWPTGHMIGWEHTFVHEIKCFFEAIVKRGSVKPDGADFEDGYRACVVADAISESSQMGRRVDIEY